jgi:hypothetical protein
MRHTGSFIDVGHPLGTVGLFLLLVVARLAGPASSTHTTTVGWAVGFAARRAIDVVGLIGWLFDRFPSPRPLGETCLRTESRRRTEAAGPTAASVRL